MQVVRTVKEFFTTETGATIAGVTTGVVAGRILGEMVKETFKLTNWHIPFGHTAINLPMGILFYSFGRATTGIAKWVLYGVAVGFSVSVLDTAVAYIVPGSPGYAVKLGRNAGLALRQAIFRVPIPTITVAPNMAPSMVAPTIQFRG